MEAFAVKQFKLTKMDIIKVMREHICNIYNVEGGLSASWIGGEPDGLTFEASSPVQAQEKP